jgi:hypothetical protein
MSPSAQATMQPQLTLQSLSFAAFRLSQPARAMFRKLGLTNYLEAAICYVTDFAWLADELGGRDVWQRMNRVSGEWQLAVAACIAAEC